MTVESVEDNALDAVLVDDLLLEESDRKYIDSASWLMRKKFDYDNESSGIGSRIWRRYFTINDCSFDVKVQIIMSTCTGSAPVQARGDSVFVTGNVGYRENWYSCVVKASSMNDDDYNRLHDFHLAGKRIQADDVEKGVRMMLVELIGISEIAKKYK